MACRLVFRQIYCHLVCYQNDYRQIISNNYDVSATYTFTGLTPGAYFQVAATWLAGGSGFGGARYTVHSGNQADANVAISQNVAPVGFMDLGATCCSRARPACERCPVAGDCGAQLAGRQAELPTPKSKVAVRKARPQRRTVMLLARAPTGAVLLERRPESGIWGGLWCPPEFASAAEARASGASLLGIAAWPAAPLATIRHCFTHFDLDIEPWLVPLAAAQAPNRVAEPDAPPARATVWYNAAQPEQSLGLPAPVKALLDELAADRID